MCWIASWVSGMTTDKTGDYTLGFIQANAGALLLVVPVCALYMLLYGSLYGWSTLMADILIIFEHPLILLLLFIVGIVAHEGIHAIGWAWLDTIDLDKIRFGFHWHTVTPYVHCEVPVTVHSYRIGTALPGIVLGVIPFLLSLMLQNGWLLGFGTLFTLAAGGDFLILWLLRKAPSRVRVQDHPDRIGCRVITGRQG